MLFGNEVADVLAVLRKTRKTYKDYLPEEAIRLGTEMADKVGDMGGHKGRDCWIGKGRNPI